MSLKGGGPGEGNAMSDLQRRGMEPEAAEWAEILPRRWYWGVILWASKDLQRRRPIGKAVGWCLRLDRHLWMAGIRL